jgi:DNA-binding transcriptional MocR family regulator
MRDMLLLPGDDRLTGQKYPPTAESGPGRILRRMPANATISFARGAPSLDIIDVEGLQEAAQRAFANDPAGTTAYGTSVGYVPLREYIAAQHDVAVEQVLVTNGSMQADAFLFGLLVGAGREAGARREQRRVLRRQRDPVRHPEHRRGRVRLRQRGRDSVSVTA